LHPDFAEGAYDETSLWSARFGALMLEHLELRSNVRGLDVGCATGFPLFELAFVHGPGSHWTGIDPWAEAIHRAHRKNGVYGFTNVELHVGDAAKMPFDNESFDLIVSNLGINNFDDPPAVMRECFRVAKRGARIVLTTNVTGHMADFYDLFRAAAPEHAEAITKQEQHRGSKESVRALLENAGFEVTRTIEDEFFLKFASGTAMFRHFLVQFFVEGWRSVVDDDAVYARLAEQLNAASPLRFRIPMLYAEAVRP
jgi:ubiquinone/menaquinone biosynthesis C-methylase UbiE